MDNKTAYIVMRQMLTNYGLMTRDKAWELNTQLIFTGGFGKSQHFALTKINILIWWLGIRL